jgi:hypothetical protein
MAHSTKPIFNPVRIAYWFFRLNGCFQIENFAVHPDADAEQNQMRTDADLLGVRFPYRDELGMKDFAPLANQKNKTLVLIAEVKRGGVCRLNGPWTNPKENNLPRVLSAIGCFSCEEIEAASSSLYSNEYYENQATVIRMIAIAAKKNKLYENSKPNVLQITWKEALGFIHSRFREHRLQKTDHGQWNCTGKKLWEYSETQDPKQFIQKVLCGMGLTATEVQSTPM